MMLDLHRYADVVFSSAPFFPKFSWIGFALAAAALSTGLTALLVKIAPARGWVVLPAENRWNRRVVAQFGGIPILLATCAVAALIPTSRPSISLLFLTLGMALLGFVDDVVGLGPKPKLAVEVLLAVLAVHAGIVHPLSGSILLNSAFTVFWIVSITNAFNLIDNIDGLASGIAVIALAQIVLLTNLKLPVGMLALWLMASVCGFLVFNFHPAKIFMGDVGSLAIGFFLACASVMTASHLSSLGSVLLVPCLVLFIPIFDMLLVSITRRINGRAISRGARDHSSHRLVLLGLTERQAVWILYVVAFIAGALAFCWERFWPAWGAGFLTLFLVGAALFWFYLAKMELPEKWLSESNVLIIRVPAFFLRIVARLSALILDGIIVILAFYFACLSNLQKLGSSFLVQFWIAAVCVVVIKLAFLAASGVYRGKWSLSGLKDTLPFFRAVFFAACFILVAWLVLPSHHGLPFSIILSDAGLSVALLLLTRASTPLFDFILGKLRPLPAAAEPFSTKPSEANPVAQFRDGGFTEEQSRKM
jgi:UDP-GlcNAc:undecaprenyl-phosphate/decaprenyl-phosphate GlcNAc-1-phosphate transferase